MTYTAKVRLLKEREGISAYRLAKEIGEKPEAVANWFSRDSVPEKFALKIARHFGVSVEILLDEEVDLK